MPKKPTSRPPRVYQRGKLNYYVDKNKKRVPIKDLNLTINNIISHARKRRPLGKQIARPVATAQLQRDQLIRQATQERQKLKEENDRAVMAQRLKQIREEDYAKSEAEKKALASLHQEELREVERLEQIRNAQRILRVQQLEREAEEQKNKMQELYSENAEYVRDQIERDRVLAEQIKRRSNAAIKGHQNRAAGQMAEAAAPAMGLPAIYEDDEKKGVDPPDEIPQRGDGAAFKPDSLPNGLNELQLNNMMDDEPRFLQTIAADEIPDLADAAHTISQDFDDFGFIVNLDKRNEDERQHWCAVYCDPDVEKVAYFYDPFGEPPTQTIANGLKLLIKRLKLPYYLSFKYNTTKNQNLNSNRCGVHCMKFLRDMFDGKTAEDATDGNEKEAMEFQKKYLI